MVAPRVRDAVFQTQFLQDLSFFITNDRKLALRLIELVHAILRDPFSGIGKPEPLNRLGAGIWSRRLTEEHRLVYEVKHETIHFIQARHHY